MNKEELDEMIREFLKSLDDRWEEEYFNTERGHAERTLYKFYEFHKLKPLDEWMDE